MPQKREVFTYFVALLTPMPAQRMRKHSFHIFQLSCLCLTANMRKLPSVKLQGVDSSCPRCRLDGVIMPAQSYFSNFEGSVAVCTTVACPDKCREAEASFRAEMLHVSLVDSHAKASFRKFFSSTHKSLKSKSVPVARSLTSSVSSTEWLQFKRSAVKCLTTVLFATTTSSDITGTAEESRQSTYIE